MSFTVEGATSANVQSSSGSTISVTISTTHANGIAFIYSIATGSFPSINCHSSTLKWTQLVGDGTPDTYWDTVWYANFTTPLSNETVTLTYYNNSTYTVSGGFAIVDTANNALTFDVDSSTGTIVNKNTSGPATFNTATANACVIGCQRYSSDNDPASGTGWNPILDNQSDSYMMIEYQNQTSTGSYTPVLASGDTGGVDSAFTFAVILNSQAYPVPGNLVLYYSFNDGTADDNSGGGHNGTFNNSQGTQSAVSGVFGNNAVKLNQAVVNGAQNFGNGYPMIGFTTSCWFRSQISDINYAFTGMNQSDDGSSGVTDRYIYINNTGEVCGYIYDQGSSASINISSPGSCNEGAWHQAVLTYDGQYYGVMSLYVDGVLVNYTNLQTPYISYSSSYWVVGYVDASGNVNYYNASVIDECLFYSRALSAAEVQLNYYGGKTQFYPVEAGLYLYYSFNDGTANDNSTGGFNENGSFNNTYGTQSEITGPSGFSNAVKLNKAIIEGAQNFGDCVTFESFTVSCWFKTTGNNYILVGVDDNQDGSSDTTDRLLAIGVAGHVVGCVYEDGDSLLVTGTTAHNDGNWHMATMTYNLSSQVFNLYVDSVLETTMSSIGAPYTEYDGSYWLVGWTNFGLTINGTNDSLDEPLTQYPDNIDEVLIYERALPQNEVNTLYLGPPSSGTTATVTGASDTTSAGNFGFLIEPSLTGAFDNTYSGTLVSLIKPFPSGASDTTHAGTLTFLVEPYASGVTGNTVAGSVFVIIDIFPSGASDTTAAGTVSNLIEPYASGASDTTAAGTLSFVIEPFLTGASDTTSAGTIFVIIQPSITGASDTTSAGTVSELIEPFLTGAQSNTALGTLAFLIEPYLTGASDTTSVGTLTASTFAGTTVYIVGVSDTTATGTLIELIEPYISGASDTTSAGTVSNLIEPYATGVQSNTNLGILAFLIEPSITGGSDTTGTGTLGLLIETFFIGAQSNSSSESVFGIIEPFLSGAQSNTALGTLAFLVETFLTGASDTTAAGILEVQTSGGETVYLIGVSDTTSTGTLIEAISGFGFSGGSDFSGAGNLSGIIEPYLSGAHSNTNLGTLAFLIEPYLTGAQSNTNLGILQLLIQTFFNGAQSNSSSESVFGTIKPSPSGVTGNTAVSSFIESILFNLSGVTGNTFVGMLIPPTGTTIANTVGAQSNSYAGNVQIAAYLSGVQSNTSLGKLILIVINPLFPPILTKIIQLPKKYNASVDF